MTINTPRYATHADAVIAARNTAKGMLRRRTITTDALLDFDAEDFTMWGDRVDEDAIRAWVEANSTLPTRIRTQRVDGHPAGGALRFQEPGEQNDEETNND